MSLIKKRKSGITKARLITHVWAEQLETLYAYADFLEEEIPYVADSLIATTLANDPEFMAWRKEHPGPFAPTQKRAGKSAKKNRTMAQKAA